MPKRAKALADLHLKLSEKHPFPLACHPSALPALTIFFTPLPAVDDPISMIVVFAFP
jgi:hypothetical protein